MLLMQLFLLLSMDCYSYCCSWWSFCPLLLLLVDRPAAPASVFGGYDALAAAGGQRSVP
jgi:hypothetical protein